MSPLMPPPVELLMMMSHFSRISALMPAIDVGVAGRLIVGPAGMDRHDARAGIVAAVDIVGDFLRLGRNMGALLLAGHSTRRRNRNDDFWGFHLPLPGGSANSLARISHGTGASSTLRTSGRLVCFGLETASITSAFR